MEPIKLAIVGCGGMGGRHLHGLRELAQSPLNNVELVAACDLKRDNAEYLADNAHEMLGTRPRVFERMEEMVAAIPELQAVDITTDAGTHHIVTCQAMELGLDVMSEKPLALTMRGCNLILEAQKKTGRLLSVAENYRRDPLCRLTKALIEAQVVGAPTMVYQVSAGGGNTLIILPWRHDKFRGGIVFDAGVHDADMLQYYLGDVEQVYAQTRQWELKRYKPKTGAGPGDHYAHWYPDLPEVIDATAEDTMFAVLNFASGVMGTWSHTYAGHGQPLGEKMIYCTQGSITPSGIRNGVSPIVHPDGAEVISGDALLELVPDFHLDEITSALFGADRMASYEGGFLVADRRLLAIEYHEFAQCLLTGAQPEVDGYEGRSALAVCYAAFESAALNRPVTCAEVEQELVNAYAAELDAHWGI